jgi:hypothetical protein
MLVPVCDEAGRFDADKAVVWPPDWLPVCPFDEPVDVDEDPAEADASGPSLDAVVSSDVASV